MAALMYRFALLSPRRSGALWRKSGQLTRQQPVLVPSSSALPFSPFPSSLVTSPSFSSSASADEESATALSQELVNERPAAGEGGIDQFFFDHQRWHAQPAVGRAWKASELRLKSYDDLHRLWYILIKERSMLLTEKAHITRKQAFSRGIFHRLWKVKKSMARIKTVNGERLRAARRRRMEAADEDISILDEIEKLEEIEATDAVQLMEGVVPPSEAETEEQKKCQSAEENDQEEIEKQEERVGR